MRASASAARAPASTRISRSAKSPMARASSAFFRCIRQWSIRSRLCAAARFGAPSSITCADAAARPPAFLNARPASGAGPKPKPKPKPQPQPSKRRGPERAQVFVARITRTAGAPRAAALHPGHRRQTLRSALSFGRSADYMRLVINNTGRFGRSLMAKPRTFYDKIWDDHLVDEQPDGTCLIYIDRHLVHEVTSPQAFEGLRASGRPVRRPEATIAVADHNLPTTDRSRGITEPESRLQVETLERNVRDFGVPYFAVDDIRQGIVH